MTYRVAAQLIKHSNAMQPIVKTKVLTYHTIRSEYSKFVPKFVHPTQSLSSLRYDIAAQLGWLYTSFLLILTTCLFCLLHSLALTHSPMWNRKLPSKSQFNKIVSSTIVTVYVNSSSSHPRVVSQNTRTPFLWNWRFYVISVNSLLKWKS